MSNWILHLDFIQLCAIVELDGDCVSNRSFLWVVILYTVALLLDAANLCSKFIDTGISSRGIGTIRWLY